MKIEVEVDDITLFAKALNNATISYDIVVSSILFGCDIPSKLEPLRNLSDDELAKRVRCLKDVYKQVEELENC